MMDIAFIFILLTISQHQQTLMSRRREFQDHTDRLMILERASVKQSKQKRPNILHASMNSAADVLICSIYRWLIFLLSNLRRRCTMWSQGANLIALQVAGILIPH